MILRLTKQEREFLEDVTIGNLVRRIRQADDHNSAVAILRDHYRISTLYKLQRKRLKELIPK